MSRDGSQAEMRNLYKLYLLGAKKCHILFIRTRELLDTALETIKVHPECGKHIEKMHLEIYQMDMLKNAIKVSCEQS